MTRSVEDPDPDSPAGRGGAAGVVPAAPPGSGGRGGLDRRRVLGAAIEFIDQQGLDALTMRRLGAHLGVEAMALYRYVPGRENLLDGVVETVIDELYGDPDVHLAASHGWQDYLQRLAHGVRRIALAHPEVFPLVATRPPAAPWVRPPLRSLRWIESFLTALIDSGFTEEAAVSAYRAYSSFLLGHLLLEVSQKGVKITPADQPEGVPEAVGTTDLGEYPTVVRLEKLLSLDESAAEFEEALENLLDRLEVVLTEAGHHAEGIRVADRPVAETVYGVSRRAWPVRLTAGTRVRIAPVRPAAPGTQEHLMSTYDSPDAPGIRSDGAHSTKGPARDAVDAQRSRYGGIKWGAAFFGWLSANGLAVLLVALLSAAGVAIGLTQGVPSTDQATEEAGTIGVAGGIVLLVVLFLAYLAGGYVAGRMARFDGARQGIAVWIIGLLVVLALALAGLVFGSQYNVLQQLNLPRIPIDEGTATTGGIIALVAVLVVTLLGAILGGKLGDRYHRKVDRAGFDA